VYVPGKAGFVEPVMKYRQSGYVLEQPYPPRRADWYSDVWYILPSDAPDEAGARSAAPTVSDQLMPASLAPLTTTDPG
jgi:hypothetical protein